MKDLHDAQRVKERQLAEMTPEQRAAAIAARNEVPLGTQVATMIWDYDHGQLAQNKLSTLQDLCTERLTEIRTAGTEKIFQKEVERIQECLRKVTK